MTIGVTISLLAVSFFGVIFWSTAANLTKTAEGAEKPPLTSRLIGHLITLTAAGITAAPLIVIIWKAAIS